MEQLTPILPQKKKKRTEGAKQTSDLSGLKAFSRQAEGASPLMVSLLHWEVLGSLLSACHLQGAR